MQWVPVGVCNPDLLFFYVLLTLIVFMEELESRSEDKGFLCLAIFARSPSVASVDH